MSPPPDPTVASLDASLRLPLALGFQGADAGAAEAGIELRFHPARELPWSAIGLTADYLGGCAMRMADQPPPFGEGFAPLANELLENAFKYRHAEHPDPVEVRLAVVKEGVMLEVRHPVRSEQAEQLFLAASEVLKRDPQALFLERARASNGAGRSGLGLWTLAQESSARVGWRLEALEGGAVRVTSLLWVATVAP